MMIHFITLSMRLRLRVKLDGLQIRKDLPQRFQSIRFNVHASFDVENF